MSNYYQELIGLSVRTRNALISYGLHTRGQVENAARLKELRKVPNIGTRAELEIKHWLEFDIKEEAQIVNAIYLLERFGFEVTKKGERRGLPRRHERNDMSTDHDIEQEIQAKHLTAPRVTPAAIEANIASEHYFTAAEGVVGATDSSHVLNHGSLDLLTFCVLVLKNGFTVTGESACASPENFDAEVGRKIARANAVSKMWPLLGFALKEKIHAERA